MNREIKFRAWDKRGKFMFLVREMFWLNKGLEVDDGATVRDCVDGVTGDIMQYTGLKSAKDLADIYEGDIIDMEGNIRGNIYESPEVYKALSTCVVAGMGHKDWENTKQRLVRQGKLVAEQSDLPQILRELG